MASLLSLFSAMSVVYISIRDGDVYDRMTCVEIGSLGSATNSGGV